MSISDKPWDGSASRFTPEQWKASCVLHLDDSMDKAAHKLPIHEPGGALNRNAVHAAASRINQVDAPPDKIAAAKRALRGAYKTLGEDPPDSVRSDPLGDQMSGEMLAVREATRTFAFDDLTIRSDGDGRTVEAYCAVFAPVRAEVRDADGHYNEELTRSSFDKTISERGTNFGVFYNHARTIYGTPDGNLSVPIGVPLEVARDDRGVFTATRYLDNPLADSILDGIKQRAIRGQSFTGRMIKSVRTRAQRGDLPLITRSEVAMKEYGPTVFPVYGDAMILGTRSVSSFLDEFAHVDPEDLERFRHMLGLATPLEPAQATGTSSEAAPSDEPALGHSTRHSKFSYAVELRQRGVTRNESTQ